MPTILRIDAYRFFFYAGDRDEPPHVHVESDASTAKFWLKPVHYERSAGFNRKEIMTIEKLVVEHQEEFLRSWDDYFGI
jgi:5-enolpyruvylshikimate-3-phosphate synthase